MKDKKMLAIIAIGIVVILAGFYLMGNSQNSATNSNGVTPTVQPVAKSDTQMEEAAKKFVTANSTPGLEFTLSQKKKVGDYARLEAIATNQTLDPLTVIMQYKNGEWVAVDMGTSFPELEEKMPDLFQ